LPSHAIIDPEVADTLPAGVIAANGFDAMAHALESYTARAHSTRAFNLGDTRPMNQGANPWSDMGAREALRLLGLNLLNAVNDPSDLHAREQVAFAALIAGMSFSNAGCHLPHGMSYAVSGLLARTPGKFLAPQGYPQHAPMVPHGLSVVLNSPAVYRATGCACPERHVEAAIMLGADIQDPREVKAEQAGEVLAQQLIKFMRSVGTPNGLNAVGYAAHDAEALAAVTFPQKRVVGNAPLTVSEADIATMFRNAMSYW
jgi:alcohol dehydrogenase class IV